MRSTRMGDEDRAGLLRMERRVWEDGAENRHHAGKLTHQLHAPLPAFLKIFGRYWRNRVVVPRFLRGFDSIEETVSLRKCTKHYVSRAVAACFCGTWSDTDHFDRSVANRVEHVASEVLRDEFPVGWNDPLLR